jgi:toxin secretion/phage lysis holin
MQHYISAITTTVHGVISKGWAKLFFSVPLSVIYSFFFGVGSETVLCALVALVVFDFITGVGASYLSGQQITSRRAFKTAMKLTVYLILVASANLVEVIIPGNPFFFSNVIISFLAVTELISVLENAGRAGYQTPQKLLHKLYKFTKDQ